MDQGGKFRTAGPAICARPKGRAQFRDAWAHTVGDGAQNGVQPDIQASADRWTGIWLIGPRTPGQSPASGLPKAARKEPARHQHRIA